MEWNGKIETLVKALLWWVFNPQLTHTKINTSSSHWWVKCVSPVPMHAVGVPYRVPSPQEQDSLRVLQYVENQLAHFNPARSISHQCKIHKPILWLHSLILLPGKHAFAKNGRCMLYCLFCHFDNIEFFSACLCMYLCTQAFCTLNNL